MPALSPEYFLFAFTGFVIFFTGLVMVNTDRGDEDDDDPFAW